MLKVLSLVKCDPACSYDQQAIKCRNIKWKWVNWAIFLVFNFLSSWYFLNKIIFQESVCISPSYQLIISATLLLIMVTTADLDKNLRSKVETAQKLSLSYKNSHLNLQLKGMLCTVCGLDMDIFKMWQLNEF